MKTCTREHLFSVLSHTMSASGNEKIDNYIQELQLKCNFFYNVVFEWISFDEFDNIEEMVKHDFSTIYSANWILEHNKNKAKYERSSNKAVILKSFRDIDKFINEVKNFI
jgi:hypothetical protein